MKNDPPGKDQDQDQTVMNDSVAYHEQPSMAEKELIQIQFDNESEQHPKQADVFIDKLSKRPSLLRSSNRSSMNGSARQSLDKQDYLNMSKMYSHFNY